MADPCGSGDGVSPMKHGTLHTLSSDTINTVIELYEGHIAKLKTFPQDSPYPASDTTIGQEIKRMEAWVRKLKKKQFKL